MDLVFRAVFGILFIRAVHFYQKHICLEQVSK